jgi:probable HAF family extracellular repeat protein
MKWRKWRNNLALLVAMALANLATGAAQSNYNVRTLPNLGGANAGANSINNRGWASGLADFSGDNVGHAGLWLNSSGVVDLGALGGPDANSAVAWPIKANNGVIVGISDTTEDNPLGEFFSCWPFYASGSPTGKICKGFRWQNNTMTALPAFPGGFNSYATAANNRGQIVGWAENGVHDPSCDPAFQILQFRAVIWQPDGTMQELPPLAGDSTSAATAINDQGQVVGISGACGIAVGDVSAAHAVIWNNGVPSDLGNFGGHAWNTPSAINNHGTVVGFSLLAGQDGTRNFHAFVWTSATGIQPLPRLANEVRSEALGINDKNQIVGLSRTTSGLRAVLWQNGLVFDMNDLTPAGSPFLLYANDINDAGEIVGEAFDPGSGDAPAYVAVPSAGNSSQASAQNRAGIALSTERLNKLERRASPLSVDPRD